MNIYEIHLAIGQGLQKNAVFAYQSLTPEEIDLHLNLEIRDYIKDIIKDADKPLDGYNKDTFNLSALKDIYAFEVEQGSISTISTPIGSKKAIIASNFYLPIKVYTEITYTCDKVLTTRKSKCRLISAELAYDMIDHIIHRPTIESPISFIEKGNIHVLTDGTFTVNKILLHYIEKYTAPKLVLNGDGSYNSVDSVQCPLHDNVHSDLIDRTIARIKSFDEGNPNVIQRLDRKQQLN